ncbi:hypothetical protein [Aeromonas phage 4L372D]|nr:hypothetical protein HWC27_gp010 [Aeromonas phage 4L372D]QEG08474.1 hypothetical protein [Aeromonas phage 4L372D]
MQNKKVNIEKQLTVYYKQESTFYVPDADPRRLLAGRLLRRYKKKNKLK